MAPTRSIIPDFGTASVVSSFGIAVDVARDMLYAGLFAIRPRRPLLQPQA
jgi:hypothetical protein